MESAVKIPIKKLILRPALISILGLFLTDGLPAQTFTNLHSFTGGSDGAYPAAGLIFSGNVLYGTADSGGGPNYPGTIFAITTNGSAVTPVLEFTDPGSYPDYKTNVDGVNPFAALILSGSTFYGTAKNGGTDGNGTVFAVGTNGGNFTVLHTFSQFTNQPGPLINGDGAYPFAGLVLSSNILYGTASQGGSNTVGTVFSVTTGGTGFKDLHDFDNTGYTPMAGLILSGSTLYGTTSTGLTGGGTQEFGTLFAINISGNGFTNFYSFTGGSDGANPTAGLLLSGSTLYGTASAGGSAGNGTVFSINSNGTGFKVLHTFSVLGTDTNGVATNSDGATPVGNLILSGNTLFGTAEFGGANGMGTVFALTTDGTNFTTLHTFTAWDTNTFTNSDGANPVAGLILSGNTLYGTAENGGWYGIGTVFSLPAVFPGVPQLTIIRSGTNVILTWPTNATGFTLQSTTNLVPTTVWSNLSGQFSVTNPISGARKFYRLLQ
jgi:uncharacterized repeat protein (TIGR03803 family)